MLETSGQNDNHFEKFVNQFIFDFIFNLSRRSISFSLTMQQ